ncbi:MAG: cell wall hydrolase [Caulobacteraceae bacterium]
MNPALVHSARCRPLSPFRLANPVDTSHDLDCLTAAVYYEARARAAKARRRSRQVVLNRVRSPAFPKTICGVVYQARPRMAASSASPATARLRRTTKPPLGPRPHCRQPALGG